MYLLNFVIPYKKGALTFPLCSAEPFIVTFPEIVRHLNSVIDESFCENFRSVIKSFYIHKELKMTNELISCGSFSFKKLDAVVLEK